MSTSKKSSSPRRPTSSLKASVGSPSDFVGAGGAPSSPVPDEERIHVFLSYARVDDRNLNIIKPFKTLFETFVFMKTNRTIQVHTDEEIEWGSRWKGELDTLIYGASVFIPLLSANYLQRPNCRVEFQKFYSVADRIGVTELVLPVLVMRSGQIFNAESDDDIVQTAIELQYEEIEDAVLSSEGSSEWKKTMARLADRFAASWSAADQKLSQLTEQDLTGLIEGTQQRASAGRADLEPLDETDEDAPGFAELMVALEDHAGEMTVAVNSIQPGMEALSAAVNGAGKPSVNSPKALQVWSLGVAHSLQGPAETIEASGRDLLNATKHMDAAVGGLRALGAELPDIQRPLDESLQAFGDLSAVRDTLNSLLASMKQAEAISSALRKALRPVRRGVQQINDSISLIQSWREV